MTRNLNDLRINWETHAGFFYVVVDPNGVVLYLDFARYLKQTAVWNSNDKSYQVLATPEDRQPTQSTSGSSSNQTSPPSGGKVPSWRSWGSSLFSSIRKWASKPLGYGKRGAMSGTYRGGNTSNLKEGSKRVSGGARRTTLRMIGNMVLPSNRNIARLLLHWGSLLLWLVGKPHISSKTMGPATKYIEHLLSKTSLLTVCKYLKVSYIVTIKFLAGQPMTNTQSLGIRIGLSNGLPKWFPLLWRHWIRTEDVAGIRFVLSFCYVYKAFEPGTIPDLSTITQDPWYGDPSDFSRFAGKLLSKVRGTSKLWSIELYPTFYQAVTSGCVSPTISLGILLDAINWFLIGGTATPLYQWFLELYPDQYLSSASRWSFSRVPLLRHFTGKVNKDGWRHRKDRASPFGLLMVLYESLQRNWPVWQGWINWPLRVGRVASFPDGGGKSRTVAIPDFWTQLALKPLHHLLMGLLKLFPQDATFAQDSALRSFANMGYKHIWSLDLKAATDTIPQQLYKAVMVHLIGVRLADLWVDLLCSRRYDVVKGCPMGKTDESVSYTRGQPMGALSSWPAMALVHHVIVLYAASRVGFGLFEFVAYLVLGDDVVIADERVAEEYILVCSELGVELSLAKSFVSRGRGVLQFASQVYICDVNVSPASLKQEVGSLKPTDRLAQVAAIISRWYPNLGITQYLKLMAPRSLWMEIASTLQGCESHPLVVLMVRMLLSPECLLRSHFGSSNPTVLVWLSTLVGNFNLSRALHHLNLGTVDLHTIPHGASLLRFALDSLIAHYERCASWLEKPWFAWSKPPFGHLGRILSEMDYLPGTGPSKFSFIAKSLGAWVLLISEHLDQRRASSSSLISEVRAVRSDLTHNLVSDLEALNTLLALFPRFHISVNMIECVLGRVEKSIQALRVDPDHLGSVLLPRSLYQEIRALGILHERCLVRLPKKLRGRTET